VLAVADHPELGAPLKRIFAGDREPVAAVSRTVIESGACDEVRRRAREHTDRALRALEVVQRSPARSLLEASPPSSPPARPDSRHRFDGLHGRSEAVHARRAGRAHTREMAEKRRVTRVGRAECISVRVDASLAIQRVDDRVAVAPVEGAGSTRRTRGRWTLLRRRWVVN
jgi:hypothetical protein